MKFSSMLVLSTTCHTQKMVWNSSLLHTSPILKARILSASWVFWSGDFRRVGDSDFGHDWPFSCMRKIQHEDDEILDDLMGQLILILV